MKQYPKWLYHESGETKIVSNQQAHLDAGPGWYESPADAKAAAANPKPPATPEPTQPAPVNPPASTQTPAAPVASDPAPPAVDDEARRQAEAEAVYASPVSALVASLNGASLDNLKSLKAIEAANPKGPRTSLLKAVDTMIAKLEADAKE